MSDVVYISVNNWFCGRDYPDTPNFRKWLGNDLKLAFDNNDWVKENKLCVNAGNIDMSSNYTITAPKEWVEQNCPELLTDDEYSYDLISSVNGRETYKKKFSDFVFHPNEDGDVEDKYGWPFLEYCEENIGVHYYEDPNEYCDEDEEDEDEEDAENE